MPYKLALLGLGRIAYSLGLDPKREKPASHSHAFAAHCGFTLAGGCDIDEVKRNRWARAYPGTIVKEDYHSLLQTEDWDVVVVALPEKDHLPALEALVQNPPRLVVMEKPAAPNLEQARRMLKICREHNIPLLINHERRFARDYQLARQILKEGTLGAICSIRGRILSNVPAVLSNDEEEGQGTLIHDGTHLLDIIGYVSEQELTLEAAISSRINSGNRSGVAVLGRVGSIPLSLEFGMGTRHFEFETEWECEQGRLCVGNGKWAVYRSRPSRWYSGFYSLKKDHRYRKPVKSAYFSGMVEACFQFLHNGADHGSGLEDSVKYLELIESIRNLLKRGKD